MAHLFNRNVLLGVSGGIAAYKSAELVRELQERGAQVRVIMTRGAQEFITPLTLQALSGHPVHTELLDERAELGMGHIELARWADLLLIAPATADLVARLSAGRADDLLSTVALATAAPLMLAPAMNQQMWAHPGVQANVACLRARGARLVGPAEGEQACGDFGAGRMSEPMEIVEAVAGIDLREIGASMQGKRVLMTAGPTLEDIDPVRFVGNRSSGKMGFAVAAAAREAGAEVVLIAGPVALCTPDGVTRVDVRSAKQMHDAVMARVDEADVFIAAAAVADYRPVAMLDNKRKKSGDTWTLELVLNPDILAEVAARPKRPFVVGFAAETERVEEHARGKLERKRLDMIAANRVGLEGCGFESCDNALSVYWAGGGEEINLGAKSDVARSLVALIAARMAER